MKVLIKRHDGERLKWELWDNTGRKLGEATLLHDRKDRIRAMWAKINPSLPVIDDVSANSSANRMALV